MTWIFLQLVNSWRTLAILFLYPCLPERWLLNTDKHWRGEWEEIKTEMLKHKSRRTEKEVKWKNVMGRVFSAKAQVKQIGSVCRGHSLMSNPLGTHVPLLNSHRLLRAPTDADSAFAEGLLVTTVRQMNSSSISVPRASRLLVLGKEQTLGMSTPVHSSTRLPEVRGPMFNPQSWA